MKVKFLKDVFLTFSTLFSLKHCQCFLVLNILIIIIETSFCARPCAKHFLNISFDSYMNFMKQVFKQITYFINEKTEDYRSEMIRMEQKFSDPNLSSTCIQTETFLNESPSAEL